MTRSRLVLAAALLAALIAAPACSSMGDNAKERLLASAPAGYEVQVITLQVTDTRFGRLTVEQTVVDLLSRREGILDVRRGTGREELYVLAEKHVDPYWLARSAPERFIVRVIDVMTTSDEHAVPGGED
jgi:hypothetical protein